MPQDAAARDGPISDGPCASPARPTQGENTRMSVRTRAAALCLALAAGALSPALSAAPQPEQARSVLWAYLDALRQGDAASAAGLLGCELRTKRLPLLRNPVYAPQLLDSYRGARIQLGAPRPVGGDAVAFVALIREPDREPTRREFLLRRVGDAAAYRVCAEGEPDAAGF